MAARPVFPLSQVSPRDFVLQKYRIHGLRSVRALRRHSCGFTTRRSNVYRKCTKTSHPFLDGVVPSITSTGSAELRNSVPAWKLRLPLIVVMQAA